MKRNRTPFSQLFAELNRELELAEKAVLRFGWLRDNAYTIQETLVSADPELARKMMLALEGHPAVPFGLNLDIEGMSLCRAVDRFQTILVKFVGWVFVNEPQTLLLWSKDQVEVGDVLQCGSIEEFRDALAGRKMRQLGGFGKVVGLLKRLGVEISLTKETESDVTNAIALRNILVHNSGRVNEEFIHMTQRDDVVLGQQLGISKEVFRNATAALRLSADALQKAIGEKFLGAGRSEIGHHHFGVFRPDLETEQE